MYHVDKNDKDPDKFEIERQLDGLDAATACALYPILEDHVLIEESELNVPKENLSAEITYERLIAERKDLEILTPREEYKDITQKIHYRCKECGNEYEERKDRLLTKQAGVGRPFNCKGCDKLEKKYITQALLLQKTQYYVAGRGGKILHLIKPKDSARRYVTPGDKLHVKCKEGHEWITTHRFLHTGAWCVKCSSLYGVDNNLLPFPNIRKGITREIEFFAWQKALRRFKMELLFPIPNRPERQYFCECQVCKNVTILTSKQLSQRRYLCLNRCIPSNMPSLTEAVVASEYFIGHPKSKEREIFNLYEEAMLKYDDWVRDKSSYPEPLKYKTKKKA